MYNYQFALETTTRCGGNCSGCALSSFERLNSKFDKTMFLQKIDLLKKEMTVIDEENTESISIFLGQGDHFLIDDEDLVFIVDSCASLVNDKNRNKILFLLTTSAIASERNVKRKMDLIYEHTIVKKIAFFIQVVFDPKKIKISKKFEQQYINNILYFKEKCGMTELTVNLGEDVLKSISPKEFHEWIKKYSFQHVEVNWVINNFTYEMWKKIQLDMFVWLKEWLLIYKQDICYEINFISFLGRAMLSKDKELLELDKDISKTLKENTYIDSNGHIYNGQMGVISNLTPFANRLNLSNFKIKESKIINRLLKNKNCSNCEYKSVCAMAGSTSWFEFDLNINNECNWGIKQFLSFFEKEIMEIQSEGKCLIETKFSKNMVQSEKILMKGMLNAKDFK